MGSFPIGAVLELVEICVLPAGARPLPAVGVLGGYVAFSYEALARISKGSDNTLTLFYFYAGLSLVSGVRGA